MPFVMALLHKRTQYIRPEFELGSLILLSAPVTVTLLVYNVRFLKVFLVFPTPFSIAFSTFFFLFQKSEYFSCLSQSMEWLLYILSLVFICPFVFMQKSVDNQWDIGIMTVFIAWFNCLLYLQR